MRIFEPKVTFSNQKYPEKQLFNSHAVGMAVARPYGFEIDFVRDPISGSVS